MSDTPSLALNQAECRVLGVLIEKGLTTPQQYPLSINAVVSGCNQTSNRDPVSHYTEEEVENTLHRLRERGLTSVVMPMSGRVNRWKQELGTAWEISAQEMAVVGELLLRGSQSEGDLRGRANRMRPIPDLSTLREVLEGLAERPQPLVIRLSPPGVQRGVRWTHALYREEELSTIKAEEAEGAPAKPSRAPSSASSSRLDELEAKVDALTARLDALEKSLGE